MPLFDGIKPVEGSRSNTHLVKSGHMSPAEKWLLDQSFSKADMSAVFNNGYLFDYQYGGFGMEKVVIPKGRVVGVAAPIKDFASKKFVTTVTLPGISTSNNVIGMVPYNISMDDTQNDKFGGNPPSIITLDYVTLPYIPSVEPAATMDKAGLMLEEKALSIDNKMPWGAVIGAGIVEGDYLKATASGRLTKWIKGTDDAIDVVGQILASDLNIEPWGWYKWMLWDESAKYGDEAYLNRSGSSNLPSDYGYPIDPKFKEGDTVLQQYQSQLINNPTGIPGLHDGYGNYSGYGKNDTEYTNVSLGTVSATATDGAKYEFQAVGYIGDKVNNLKEVTDVKIDGVSVDPTKYTVKLVGGVITVEVLAAQAGKAVTATFKAFHYGTPSYLDFKGVVGSFNILLKR